MGIVDDIKEILGKTTIANVVSGGVILYGVWTLGHNIAIEGMMDRFVDLLLVCTGYLFAKSS